MKFLILFALFAISNAGVLHQAPVLTHAPVITKSIVQAPVAIPTIVNTGYSTHAFSVPESRFTRSDWETPGATYAIPAVARYSVTRPGYTTYQEGPSIAQTHYAKTSVPVATYTAHAAPLAYAAAPVHAYAPAHGYAAW